MTMRNSIATGAALLVLASTPAFAQDTKSGQPPATDTTKLALPAYDFAAAEATATKAVKGSIQGMRLGKFNRKNVIFIRMQTPEGTARVIVDAANGKLIASDTDLNPWKERRHKRGWGWRWRHHDDAGWCNRGSKDGKSSWFDGWW